MDNENVEDQNENGTGEMKRDPVLDKLQQLEQEIFQISAQLVDAQSKVKSLEEVRSAKIEAFQAVSELQQ